MKTERFIFAMALAVVAVCFQNCSKVGFNSGDDSQASTPVAGTISVPGLGPDAFPGQNNVNGITGGHFDLDTSTKIYPPSKGTTDHHVHEYDKIHQTTTMDFFNLIDSGFDNIQMTIPAGQQFVLNVVNASLSPGGVLDINGTLSNVTKFQRGQLYTVGSAASGAIQLNQFRLGFSPDVLANNGLIPTVTGCVRANDPGKLGEYRNGALTIQALDASNYTLDPATGAATSGLLWEATVFWHWTGACY